MTAPSQIAAVDLGSNSFHMVVARYEDGKLAVMDRIREQVGLAGGLDKDHNIEPQAWSRALECLERFGERIHEVPSTAARAVGTSTLRRAKNSAAFLIEAERALGHPIELISGQEEARLVYLGVDRSVPELPRRRIVVDIGGGSTELILGEGNRAVERDSVQMGHLRWTVKYFPDGRFTRDRFAAARTRGQIELGGLMRRYRSLGWEVAYGSSGTARAIEEIGRANGWSDGGITPRSLRKLEQLILRAGSVNALIARGVPGLNPDRAAVIAGGLSILSAVFETLHIHEMTASQGALREGVLHDLLGRIRHDDARDVTIESFQRRYSVDREHAARVQRTAVALFQQVADTWGIDPSAGQQMLSWAALLHEVGLSVNHSGYHKHGAYLLQFADMPGFSRADQAMLSMLVGSHRRSLHLDKTSAGTTLGPAQQQLALQLAVLLRLAVRLHRTRSSRPLPKISLTLAGDELTMRFPPGWLDEHPLRRADLVDEATLLTAIGLTLTVL
jgi:exopolyphosphatase/guanosine-5'-triphosphate,3'-diphosphate pyrophosphatase